MEDDLKQKIAIVTQQMAMGGIERSLIQLCKALLKRNVQVTLYLVLLGGELYQELPSEVRVIYMFEDYKTMPQILRSSIRKKDYKAFYAALKSWFINHTNGDPVKGWKYVSEYMNIIEDKFDYVFAYGAPISFSVVVTERFVNAKKKYVWIHNDPTQTSLNIQQYSELYKGYDRIICVSKKTKDSFIRLLPEFKEKVEVFYNIIDADRILKKAEVIIIDEDKSVIKILTVGRLHYEKGQDIIPNIVKRLLNDNLLFKWYCVGDGVYKQSLENIIKKEKLEKNLILLGNQNNPYPYFKSADIYVQTSRSEAFGNTITEAKIFNLPIITTNFDGADEQIISGKTGLIVSFNEDELYKSIKKMILDANYRKEFQRNLNNDRNRCISDINKLLSD
ncbi:glycosyltransferase [Murimonas intestini]|uniref:Glycosyltransferase involved in cell wall biosynthesis n=1 Tax=Murimonas intestini TaxID=1337051 RepID=A0AB73T6J8_9FIRM|nr:glycosyltransferase [Murimonas intestini]MCR1839596.1 glycosyltransferase [Murimonas intestini]MCR1866439.1 glycosyltransferase [Murimonas intestini]MCR1882443.1 glycosyltransferase [Murimonas intestini]